MDFNAKVVGPVYLPRGRDLSATDVIARKYKYFWNFYKLNFLHLVPNKSPNISRNKINIRSICYDRYILANEWGETIQIWKLLEVSLKQLRGIQMQCDVWKISSLKNNV